MCKDGEFDGRDLPRFNRRQFALLSGSAALAACTGVNGSMGETSRGPSLAESSVTIATSDGQADAFFVHPASGRHPAVLLWPDIAGLRDAFRMMARRLAERGYAVLVVNPYYRDVAGEQFEDFAAFRAGGGFDKVGPWRGKLTAEPIMRDARALVGWLDRQASVDTARGIGTQGYCMGGPFTVWTAAAVPSRVAAAASFHGGGLVAEDNPMSPHALLGGTPDTGYIFAIAQDDDAEAPAVKTVLRHAAQAADVRAEVEVYPADHGWAVPDSPAYDRAETERAWANLLALYARQLG
tara:strand:+ start:1158 stop:2042 length:885 start_codon:yes stop_codon:yes gene_type:complete